MRQRWLFPLSVFLVFIVSSGPQVWTDPASPNTQGSGRNQTGADDPIADFLGNPGTAAPVVPAYPAGDSLNTVLPAWAEKQDPSAESKLGWALLDVTQTAGTVAKTVKNSLTASIGDYVKEKQKQVRQQDLVHKFYVNLDYVIGSLKLTLSDHDELVSRVKREYIEDAESGRRQLDSQHFRELPYIVRKEYADMLLARTRDGEVDTYYLSGARKTHWVLKNGQPEGAVVTNYENGEILTIDLFKDGRKIRRTRYDPDGRLEFKQDYNYELDGTEKSLPEKKNFDPADLESLLESGNAEEALKKPAPGIAAADQNDNLKKP